MKHISQFILRQGYATGVQFLFEEELRILQNFLSVERPETHIREHVDTVLSGERDCAVYAGMEYTVVIQRARSIIKGNSIDRGVTCELGTSELKELIDDWYAACEQFKANFPYPTIIPTEALHRELPKQIPLDKGPFCLSFPVLRLDDGEWTIACFGCRTAKDGHTIKKIWRPDVWETADLKTGQVKNVYDCRERDFSTAPFDAPMDLSIIGEEDAHHLKADLHKMDSYFDSLRFELLVTGNLNEPLYDRYLNLLLQPIPEGGKRFFLELVGRPTTQT